MPADDSAVAVRIPDNLPSVFTTLLSAKCRAGCGNTAPCRQVFSRKEVKFSRHAQNLPAWLSRGHSLPRFYEWQPTCYLHARRSGAQRGIPENTSARGSFRVPHCNFRFAKLRNVSCQPSPFGYTRNRLIGNGRSLSSLPPRKGNKSKQISAISSVR